MKRILIAVVTLLSVTIAYADKIKVKNVSNLDLFAAIYYESTAYGSANRASDVVLIKSQETTKMERPDEKKLTSRRKLVFAGDSDQLKKDLSYKQYSVLGKVSIGTGTGDEFFLDYEKGKLNGYGKKRYTLLKPIKDLSSKVQDKTFEAAKEFIVSQEDKQVEASVRTSSGISNEEQNYLKKKMPKVKAALEKMLNMKINDNQVPRIAFCGSGGGFRAMLATLGALIGADSFGLLESSVYVSALSGSTWAIAPWIYSGLAIKDYYNQLVPRLSTTLISKDFHEISAKDLTSAIFNKIIWKQPLSLIDVYGVALGSKLLSGFNGKYYDAKLSSQVERLEKSNSIFPIYTAIMPGISTTWIEFNPYEIGSKELGGFVPTKTFGSNFNNGKMVDYAPEQSLEFYMGIWGSAISIGIRELLERLESKINVPSVIKSMTLGTEETRIGETRVALAKVFNPVFAMTQFPKGKDEVIPLADSGIDFNIPVPPLLIKEREVDIIIIVDASHSVTSGNQLKKIQQYAKSNKIKIPEYTAEQLANKNISIIKDANDPKAPVWIYIPLIANDKYSKSFNPTKAENTKTFNFIYTKQQADELKGLTEFAVTENKDIILQTIKDVIKSKA